MREWTTENRHPSEQYGYWREVICQAYTVVDPTPRTRERFESRVLSSELDGLTITRTRSKAQTVIRGARELRRKMSEEYYVILQLGGNLRVEQGSREALIRPGEFVMIDAAERYRLEWEDWNVLCFAVPHHRINPLLRIPHAATAIRRSPHQGLDRLARDYMLSLHGVSESLPAAAQQTTASHLIHLVALGFEPTADASEAGAPAIAGSLRALLDAYIDRHLSDPQLSVTTAARHFHVSPRTLHRHFEATGSSFAQSVLEKRLARAARLLKEPGRQWPVSEVAYRSGFNDLSHFGRVFRRRFGVSAGEFRQT